jgi:SecD/SecF fusion protein
MGDRRIKDFFKRENLSPRLTEYKVFNKAGFWFIVPLVIVLIAIIAGVTYQFSPRYDGFANVSVDFRGGTVLTVTMQGPAMLGENHDRHLQMINDIARDEAGTRGLAVNPTDPRTSGTNAIIVRYSNTVNVNGVMESWATADMDGLNRLIGEEIEQAFKDLHGDNILTIHASAASVGATASSRAIGQAVLAIGVAIAVALIYILIRFSSFTALATIVGVIHDVVIMFMLTVLFRIPIGMSFIAAVITIIAYTTNNSIILFDKVREQVKPFKNRKHKIDVETVVNSSVTQTFTRQFFAFITTFIPIVVLAAVGITALQEFTLPVIFGLMAGFYSTMFVAPSAWGLMMQAYQKRLTKNFSQQEIDEPAEPVKTKTYVNKNTHGRQVLTNKPGSGRK